MSGKSKNSHPMAGFSLVEVMVGLVIGLLTLLVIMQVYATWEGQKRSTTSGSDAQVNGAVALYSIQRDMQMAGYGFASLDALNCKVLAYNDQRDPNEFNFPAIAPVVINPTDIPAGDSNTDVVEISYGDSDGLVDGVGFQQQSGASANYKVQNRAGFTVGDMVIAVEPGLDCTVAQVTDLPASGSCGQGGGTGQTDVVVHNNGQFNDPRQSCSQVASHWNKPGGLGVTYTDGTLYNLGAMPKTVVYAVRGGNLTACDFYAQDCTDAAKTTDASVWVPIVNGIVSLQAQYGRDTSAPMDQVADVYDQTTPTTACGWARIPAVRIAVAARSTQYEKDAVTGAAPSWLGGSIDLSANADWKHYRYKVFETLVPLRNVIWMGVQPSC